jgi:hypothetical protein
MTFMPMLLAAGAFAPTGAETVAELFPAPALLPLTMAALDGAHVFSTEHSGVFNGHHIRYQATVAETVIQDPGEVPAADL